MNHVPVKKNKDDVILSFGICNNCDFECKKMCDLY